MTMMPPQTLAPSMPMGSMMPPQTMSQSMMPMGSAAFIPGGAPMMGPPMQSMPPQMTQQGGAPFSMQGQYMPNVSRPIMVAPQNPPVIAGNIQYGPSYKMQYQKRSTADKTAVKYTGFLPLEGVYEEDTCRIG